MRNSLKQLIDAELSQLPGPQHLTPIPAKDHTWSGILPGERSPNATPKEKSLRCCAALRQILRGERQAPDYQTTVLGGHQ
ncbi:hypothetical protein [Celerinatantimonas sp. MCCC 1A17872]|uniref:hypothetical protein n=1 Tax=Celerinatantimonas sp. MCCC 1A17872 TaxID=3177514 RepID=UPI0038C7D157